MNSDQMKGKWKQMKGSVKERWGKLTDDDIDIIDGQQDQLIGNDTGTIWNRSRSGAEASRRVECQRPRIRS